MHRACYSLASFVRPHLHRHGHTLRPLLTGRLVDLSCFNGHEPLPPSSEISACPPRRCFICPSTATVCGAPAVPVLSPCHAPPRHHFAPTGRPVRIRFTPVLRLTQFTLPPAATCAMLPLIPPMERQDFQCLRLWGGARLSSCVRYIYHGLHWERLSHSPTDVTHPSTPVITAGHFLRNLRAFPDDVVRALCRHR